MGTIKISGATENNLKNILVGISHNCPTVVTGPSGSNKSSLVSDIFARVGQRMYLETNAKAKNLKAGAFPFNNKQGQCNEFNNTGT